MFPNVRLMAASTLASVVALFFAFGVYASLRVSHEPLIRSSRAAPLQLVGFNVAMLPAAVLEPFASPRTAASSAGADNGPALAYSAPQASAPQKAPPVAGAAEARSDNAATDEPAENNDVTQMQITEALDTTREPKLPDVTATESVEPTGSIQQSTDATAAAASSPPAPSPPAAPSAVPAAPQISPVEHTATIETVPAAAEEPAAADEDTAADTDIVSKKKKKKHVARRHFFRAPVRAVAQTTAQQPWSNWPGGVGGPLVTAPKR